MSTAVAIKVHSSRGEQLRRIAAARGFPSVVGAIEHFIAAEIKAGTIPDALPGFDVAVTDSMSGRVVMFDFEGFLIPDVPPVLAHQIARAIEMLATSRGRDAGYGVFIGEDTRLHIARKGTGLLLKGEHQHITVATDISLSFSMALELATMIRRAANQALGLSDA